MWFVGLGVLLIFLNLAGVGPVGEWVWPGDWWKMCWPFGLALAWWIYSDNVGLTTKRQMDKIERKKQERRKKSLNALGMDERGRRQKAD